LQMSQRRAGERVESTVARRAHIPPHTRRGAPLVECLRPAIPARPCLGELRTGLDFCLSLR
jgi:hypothetical protein